MTAKRLSRRLQRRLQAQQQQVEDLGQSAEKGFERHFLRRLGHLQLVQRFVIGWIGLFLLLIGCLIWELFNLSGYYQSAKPVSGGIYTEGIVGTVSNVNPIYATSDVDSSLAHLLFAGLLTYNNQNKLVGDLATGYSVNAAGTVYTLHLKPGLTWQDGQPLTSADVVFTYKTIQDPDAQSPLLNSWHGITVAAPDARTVTFTLPSPLASFPYNLTTGIIPKHILASVAANNLRSIDFNTAHPIGAGPFRWGGLQVSGTDPSNVEEQITLTPFEGYAAGQPKLTEFIMHSYASQALLAQAYMQRQVTAAADLDTVPAGVTSDKTHQVHNLLETAGCYVFFKTDAGVLADAKVRQALTLASNPRQIINQLGYTTRPVNEPFLKGQLAYTPKYAQQTNNLASARSILQQDGWQTNAKGVMVKNGQPLTFTLVATDIPEYRADTTLLTQQWRRLGAVAQVQLEDSSDYTQTLESHGYDATLYSISIGVDPDVFVYWDSSQADIRSANRLNLSEWKNGTADASLEAGRTRLAPALRVIKYQPFLQAWQQDNPALGLYQPRYLYLTNGPVYGLTTHAINEATDRFDNVQNWEIRTARVTD